MPLGKKSLFIPGWQKSLFIPGCVQGAITSLFCLCVLSVCVTFVVFTDCERCTRPISRRWIYGSGYVRANVCDVHFRAPSRCGRGGQAVVDLVVCFGWSRFFLVFQVTSLSNSCPSTRPLAARGPAQSASTRLRGYDSQPICPPRTRAYPHQVYHLLCNHLGGMVSSVSSSAK